MPGILSGLACAALSASAGAQVTQRASVSSGGVQGDNASGNYGSSITPDGRYVAFVSAATNLVPGDVGPWDDIFVRDLQTGTTQRVSISTAGVEGNSYSAYPSISDDGRHVAFASFAANLVAGDTNGTWDIFVHDRQSATTERVSVDSSEMQADDDSSERPWISADGLYVAFASSATNLVAIDTNGFPDVFVRDLQGGTTERVSVDSSGAEANGFGSFCAAISSDGRFVVFTSHATNLIAGDTNGWLDYFIRDRLNSTTEIVNISSDGAQGNNSNGPDAAVSADGRYVAFESASTNLVAGDTNGLLDVFVRDRQSGTTERASIDSGGIQANNNSRNPAISADGRYVAFASDAANLVAGDSNGVQDVFVRDRQSATTQRVNLHSDGTQANSESAYPSISGDGRYVSFRSSATNLVPGDTNGSDDVFVRDRTGGLTLTGLCDPGVGGVVACPCSNQPNGPGRGCDNSAGTGGAILSASGGAYLSSDSLVFTTSGENPTSLSLVLQGTAQAPDGQVLGAGVHCTGGSVKRLYTKMASGGSIVAPDFGMGDPAVSARSAALGDTILSGQSRWYFVAYRESAQPRGCQEKVGTIEPFAEMLFNATQTGRVSWSP
ncbi:MAG: TolB family protein [Planctomycetota bacterium]